MTSGYIREFRGRVEVSEGGRNFQAVALETKAAISRDIEGAVQDDVDALPIVLRYDVEFGLSGQLAGWAVESFMGRGQLTFNGDYAEANGVTGATSGLAGAGTTSTSMVKPAGAPNWVAGALVGKFLIQGDNVRPIRANTTTSLTVDAIVGLAADSPFVIGSPSVEVTSDVWVEGNNAPIVFKGIKFSADLLTEENRKVIVDGCEISGGDWLATYDGLVIFKNCVIKNNHKLHASKTYRGAEIDNVYLDNGQVRVEHCPYVSVQGEARECVANALYLAHCSYAQGEMLANDCDVTPFYFNNVGYFEAVGTDKLNGTGNTGYGMSINTAGRYRIIGCAPTGTLGNLDFDGSVVAWSDLASSTYGVAIKYGSTLVAESGQNKALNYGAYTNMGGQEDTARSLFYGYMNDSQQVALTATGTTQADALQLGQWAYNRFDTVPAGSGCRLANGIVLPGGDQYVDNNTAENLKVYPETNGQLISGAASVTVPPGACYHFKSRAASGGLISWVKVGA